MVRSCEREGWSGGKLDLVWTSLVCIDDSAWFLKTWLCSSRFSFLVIFRVFSWDFRWEVLGVFLWGIFLDVTYEDLVPLCLVILIQQTLRNGFDLGDLGGFHGKVFLRVDFRILLFDWVLGTELLAKGSPRGAPAIPKVSLWSVEQIGRSIA
jgi:hypothetical protein